MKLTYITSKSTNPYENLALEEYLLKHTKPDECILYLWQNQNTVVIGFNQNAWKECRVEILNDDKGTLARRLSGGGAVFHDLGNLNFTFLVRKGNYDLEKQTEVILKAVQSFGIPAIRTGRNDLTVDDKKFSGNAFYNTGDYSCHHGTLLIDVDKEKMPKYLNASVKKLESKGVKSVKSRVCNLNEYNEAVTIETMEIALITAFEEVYSGKALQIEEERAIQEEIDTFKGKYADWDWVYGREIPFNMQWDHRFPWGEVQIQISSVGGIMNDIRVWTDAMEVELSQQLEDAWRGVRLSKDEMKAKLNPLDDKLMEIWSVFMKDNI